MDLTHHKEGGVVLSREADRVKQREAELEGEGVECSRVWYDG